MVVPLAVAHVFKYVHVFEVVVILEFEPFLDLKDALLLVQLFIRPVSNLENDVSQLINDDAFLDNLGEHIVVYVFFAV